MNAICLNLHRNINDGIDAAAGVVRSTTPPEALSLSIRIANIARYILSASKNLLNNAKQLATVGVLKLITIATVPMALYDIAVSVKSAVKSTFNEKVDLLIGVVSTIGGIGDIVCNIAEGLAATGLVATKAVAWATPLNIAAVAIESVGLLITTKSIIETSRFSAVFNQTAGLNKSVEEYDLEDFEHACKLLGAKQREESSFMGKHFRTDSGKLMRSLIAIHAEAKSMLASDNPQTVLQGKQKLHTTMQTLSQRMTNKNWSSGLTLLAGIVGVVGFGILFSPCPAAGFGLLVVSSVLSMINFFADKVVSNRFEKQLGIA